MDVGDLVVYPTCGGECMNPYIRSTPEGWKREGWSAFVVIEPGRALGVLSWYTPLTISSAMSQRPAVADLRVPLIWKLENPGTCSAAHFKRMELEKIAALPIDGDALRRAFPGIRPGATYAINDISIANRLSV